MLHWITMKYAVSRMKILGRMRTPVREAFSYGIRHIHCDSMKRKVILHWITMNMLFPLPYSVWKCLPYGEYASSLLPHVRDCTISVLCSVVREIFVVIFNNYIFVYKWRSVIISTCGWVQVSYRAWTTSRYNFFFFCISSTLPTKSHEKEYFPMYLKVTFLKANPPHFYDLTALFGIAWDDQTY